MLSKMAFGRMTCRAVMFFFHSLSEEPSQLRSMSMLSFKPMAVAALAIICLLGPPSIGTTLVWAQTGGLGRSPAEIVKKYFELDQKGAKLDSISFEALAPYRAWETEPVWGKVIVI